MKQCKQFNIYFDYYLFFDRNVNGNYLDCKRYSSGGEISSKIICNQDSQRTTAKTSNSNTTLYVVLGVLIFVLVVVVVFIVLLVLRRMKRGKQNEVYMDESNSQGKETKKAPEEKKKKTVEKDNKKVYLIPHSELVMEDLIGKGATSSVYKGRWKKHEVAIKSVKF